MKKANKSESTKKTVLIVGLVLMAVTFGLNDRLLAEFFPSFQGAISNNIKIGIFIVDVIFAVVVIFVLARGQPRAKIFLDAAVGLGFAIVLIAGIEAAFYALNLQNRRPIEEVEITILNGVEPKNQAGEDQMAAPFQRDEWLGYKLTPNIQVAAYRETSDQTVLYDVVYTVDSQGRRVTPDNSATTASRYILFFGGSYTFGEGVNDDQTMPYYVSQLAPDYRAYNYGVGGYGPQQVLAQLQRDDVTEGVAEPQGLLVYTFISEHIDRAIGTMLIHNLRGQVMPYYYLDSNGNLVRNGTLVSGRPVTSLFYKIAGASQTLAFFGINFPQHHRPQDLQTTVAIINEARQLYREKFKNDNFVVLIYPTLGVPAMLPYLDAAGITYLDYSMLPEAQNRDFWLGEGHPSAKGHKIVAEKLTHDLGLLDETRGASSTNQAADK